ncbi:O-antigen ligase family protein [Candidatus Leptofilum sp.]|uniref:O-antigen ligase family protein n=1 Tax=Candidatus Leptofilum sp. TaxID=3241576 RepID=UPI003B5B104B
MNSVQNPQRARWLTLFWLLLGFVALLSVGGLQLRHNFLTRGLTADLPEPINYGGVQPGLNVYLNQYDDAALAENLQQISDLGIQFVKQPFYFSEDFDWEKADRLVTAVSQHNLTLVPLLDGNPAADFAPMETAVFAQFANEFAQRYGDAIQFYIIWDEPNLASHWGNQPPNPDDYGALLSAAANAIRSADSDAVIVAAPLAPTTETGPNNLADHLFLQQLYETGVADAFDIVAAKPYGFDSSPDDRTVNNETLNFSRVILLREVMTRNGDGRKAIWAGNWGWNSLPAAWPGNPSIWGDVSAAQQADYTIAALERARLEWPWLGVAFLENWQPDAPADDPIWGFSVAGSETAVALQNHLNTQNPAVAQPGFHLAQPNHPAQIYEGNWEFSPEFGADIGQQPDGVLLGDKVTFTFYGTDLGLRVRRANFRARFYITIDGQPANALPRDENGAMLILTSAVKSDDYIATEWVARNLPPGVHTAEIVASRGWDQWALNGFSVGYQPADAWYRWGMGILLGTAVLSFILAIRIGWRAGWPAWFRRQRERFTALNASWQLGVTAVTAALVLLAGWFTWAEQMGGLYRRLGDGSQLALTAAVASIYYVTPTFFIYTTALVVLFVLLYWRPVWGLVLIAFCFPFYVPPLPKPILNYRFSPIEVFTLVTFAAYAFNRFTTYLQRFKQHNRLPITDYRILITDYGVIALTTIATATLFFTNRLDVASNEWRVVILEPALFYWVLRGTRPKASEMWRILDGFVLGGLVVAAYGLWQIGFARDQLITAEGGLLRLKSIYGSPNNVALYLGRLVPLLGAMTLLGSKQVHGKRWWLYTAVLIPTLLAFLLTFSKGGLFLGLPAAFVVIFWQWQRVNGRKTWPWLLAFGATGVAGLLAIEQIPALAGRLSLTGETGVFRLSLWQASLNIIADHPWFGVGLDNFLYEYRGRYILESAWRDPNLSHPHNLFLDFATRLGLPGLLIGLWLIGTLARVLWQLRPRISGEWLPVVVGLAAALADMVFHGLVDHSFFLVDLAFAFYLLLGTAVWLQENAFRDPSGFQE